MTVVLADDASTDGTSEMVSRLFPDVEVLRGNGNLYWVGGMRLALERLYSQRMDYYLWLNDDTVLDPGTLQTLLATQRSMAAQCGGEGIVVGSTLDVNGCPSYGGLRRRPRRLGGLSFDLVVPEDKPLECDTHNGNVVLVSAATVAKLGNLDAVFQHGMADIDYGLRAKAAGIPVWLMPGYAGRCDRNQFAAGSFLDKSLPLSRRWKLLSSPKVLPYVPWLTLCRRHAGRLWALHFSWPYTQAVVSSLAHSVMRLGAR